MHFIEHGIDEPYQLQFDLDSYIFNQDVVSHDQGEYINIDAETGADATLIDGHYYFDYANYGRESFLSQADGFDPNEVQV